MKNTFSSTGHKICSLVYTETGRLSVQELWLNFGAKGNRAFADLRYGEEDSISLSTLFFAATNGLLRIYTFHIPPEVL